MQRVNILMIFVLQKGKLSEGVMFALFCTLVWKPVAEGVPQGLCGGFQGLGGVKAAAQDRTGSRYYLPITYGLQLLKSFNF